MRLLPDDPVPQLTAAHIMTFAGAPQRAADLWLGVSRTAPELALQSDGYVLSALAGRLREIGDGSRADRLEARMAEIGFASMLAPARSSAALARVREAIIAGGADAGAGVAAIGDPDDLLTLAIDRRYAAVWPQVATWGGAGMEDASRRYLSELRRDWESGQRLDAGAAYARRLARLRAYPAVVALFLPALEAPGLTAEAEGIEFLAPVVARSLAAVGRGAEGEALIARIATLFAGDRTGRGLNLAAARVTLAANDERWEAVLPPAAAFLADAAALGPAVNGSATLMVRAMQGCALWKLDRRDEAERVMAGVMLAQAALPGAAFRVLLCRGDHAAARDFLLARLADETIRSWALRVVQPETLDPVTALNRNDDRVMAPLRRDPAVIAAVRRVGLLLPVPVGEALPAGFDPLAPSGKARPVPGSI